MPALLHGVIILASTEERFARVDVPLVEDSVDCNCQKVTEGEHDCMVGVQYRGIIAVVGHVDGVTRVDEVL